MKKQSGKDIKILKYRDHRGGLDESMKTVQEVVSVQEIKNHLNRKFKSFGKEVEEVKFEYAGFDERVDWDTYYVIVRLSGEKETWVIGMTNGTLDEDGVV